MALAEFIVAFREFFEISLLVGIMLAYLYKTGNGRFAGNVWIGAAFAGIASVLAAALFGFAEEAFEPVEALFEGVTLIVAAALVTWLILWMLKHRKIAQEVERGVGRQAMLGSGIGIAMLSFVNIFREGIEIVLFLNGIRISSGAVSIAAVAIGFALAVVAAYLIFRHIVHVRLSRFFKFTSIILVLLAAGLFSQGIHELEEAGALPVIVEHVYDITPPMNADGSYALMHEKGAVGGILKGIVGYDTAPSLSQVLGYFAYLGIVYAAYLRLRKNREKPGHETDKGVKGVDSE
ncbi:MAG: FTR1 family protein [Candidatus Diapherotrites archaeon]|nr:FTR1 family protein [Candidatus Diapherotrites archaeon]